MAYSVTLSPRARRQLLKLPADIGRRIERAIDALVEDPRPEGARKLEGGDDLYRIRVGDYRIVYQAEDKELLILVLKVGHRRDVYRRR